MDELKQYIIHNYSDFLTKCELGILSDYTLLKEAIIYVDNGEHSNTFTEWFTNQLNLW